MIYLDYNGTSPFSSSVRKYLADGAISDWANPSAEHDVGYSQKLKLQNDREAVASILGWNPAQLIFTSGGTESINSVLNRDTLNGHGITSIISSPLEHSATLACLKNLENQGFKILWLKHSATGSLSYDHLKQLCRDNPRSLVALLYVNNETGVINDANAICKVARENGCLIHLDAVQALGKLSCDFGSIDCDFASFSGHKIGSLKGCGILYVNEIKKALPLLLGGGQEQGKRAGTSNAMGVKSFRLALEDAQKWNLKSIENIRNKLTVKILQAIPGAKLNCSDEPAVCNTANIYIPQSTAKSVLLNAGRAGVMISTGSACTSGVDKPSYVIEASYGVDRALSSIRISIGQDTDEGMVEQIVSGIRT